MATTGGRPPSPLSGICAGLALTMVVSVPTLVIAEDWHGHPLIDQGGLGWMVPGAVVALAFLAGGALAGRAGRRAAGALTRGIGVGALAVLLLLAADIARRLLMNPTLPAGVVAYWMDGAAAALFMALVGSAIGHGWARARIGRARPGSRAGAGPAGA
ncbi:MAG: hypothetical protein ACRDY3_09550 [Acidimicrobiales bacterium]